VTAALFISFILLILVRVPIAMAIGASVVLAILLSDFADALYIVPTQILEGVDNASLLAVPFFVLAGNLMNETRLTDRIFTFASALVGHMKAGLAQVNVLASMLFAGSNGAAVADIAGLGTIEIRAMRERGYPADFAAAITVASSVVGPLIPPSVGLVVYAFLSGVSVARLFLAGIIPGILVGLSLMLYNRWAAGRYDFPREPRASLKTVARTGVDGIAALIAPAIIIAALLTGFTTASEAGVLACVYAILVGLIYREITLLRLWNALTETMLITSVIMIIIGFSTVLGWLMAIDQVPQAIGEAILFVTEDKPVFLALLLAFFLLIGCFVEGVPAKLILVPMLLPVTDSFGIDRVHFGIIVQLALLIGIATPPMGIGLYIAAEVGKVPFEKVTMAVLPFLVPLTIVLVLITYIPAIVLTLPDLVMGPG
jgi:tripartite ATP-independent transporter DctM subunit